MEKVTLSNYGYKVAQIEINANCNMACSFCPYPIKEDKTTKLPTQDIINTIDQIDAMTKNLTISVFHRSMNLCLIIDFLKLLNTQKNLVLKLD